MTEETNADLVQRAQRDYGELIDHFVLWPEKLGIDVHLIGGKVVQYYSGGKYDLDQPTFKDKVSRFLSKLLGNLRKMF